MTLLFKYLVFFLFLVLYIGWLLGLSKLTNKLQKNLIKKRGNFITQEIMLIVMLAGLFGFVGILTGFINLGLIALFFISANFGYLITSIVWLLIGSASFNWTPETLLAGFEFGAKHSILMKIVMISAGIIFLFVYPTIIGITYFSHVIPSDQATVLIFRYTITTFFITTWLIYLPVQIGLLISKNLDEQARTRYLISQIGQLVYIALFFALTFWAFGIAGQGYKLQIIDTSIFISPLLVLAIFLFFIFTTLLPYFIGLQQAKKWRIQLFEKKEEWVEKSIEILSFPEISKINELLIEIKKDLKIFIAEDEMLKLSEEIEKNPQAFITPQLDLPKVCQETRHLDPRFKYMDFLIDLKNKINEITLKSAKSETTETSKAFADNFKIQKADLEKDIKEEKEKKSAVSGIVYFIIAAIFSPILSEFGKWIWTSFIKNLIH